MKTRSKTFQAKLKAFLTASFCWFLLCPYPTHAQVFEIKDWQPDYDLQLFTSISEDISENISVENISEKMSIVPFINFSEHPFKIKINQFYLGKIQIKNSLANASKHTEWILEFTSSWTHLDIFVEESEHSFEHYRTGAFVSYKEKSFLPEMEGSYLKLYLPPEKLITIFFRGKGERGNNPPTFRASLQHSDSFFEDLKTRRKNHALFIGFVIMMLVYNLIFYFINHDKSYLYYSLYLSAFVLYTSFVSGDLADWVEPIFAPNHSEYMYFGKLGVYFGLMAYVAFIRTFLDLKELLPKWDKFFNIFFWLGIPWIIVDVILMFVTNFSYTIGDTITVVYILLFVFSNVFFIYQLFRTRDKKGYFIIIGLTAICIGMFLTSMEWKWSSDFTMIYAKIGSIIEIIVFSLGLAYRQWENQKIKQKINLDLAKSKIEQQQEQAEAIRLKELDQIKTNFYANITHEFRTPLTVIQGMANQIAGKYQKETQLIQRNSQNLLHLVNQILDLSKLESGKLNLQLQRGNMVAFLKKEIESYLAFATSNEIELTFHSSSDKIEMDFDVQKMRQIIANLLSNAIKFMNKKGAIEIFVNELLQIDAHQLELKIMDSGIGISEEQLPHIFNRFYQADNSSTRRGEPARLRHAGGGTGIGLALVKELVELMNGKIKVQSELNKGTTFTLTFPITQNAPSTDFEEDWQPLIYSPSNTKTTKIVASSFLENSENPIALIIEDNEDVIQYLISCLQDDYKILTSLNGKEGIQTALEKTPDIIISDVMMPEADGFEVTQHLKNDERTSHIPIILLTAKTDHTSKLEGLESGADAYLAKPFDQAELMIRLEKMIALRKILQKKYASPEVILKPKKETLSKEELFLEKIKTHVESHLDDTSYGVEYLAKDMNLSRQQLYRKTKALTGKSVASYVRLIRLHFGKRLLQTTNLNVSEVAYQVGFNDPNYFSKSFSEEFGYPPSEKN